MKKKITLLITIIVATLLLFLNMTSVHAEDEENVVLYNFTRFYEYTGQEIKIDDLVLTYNGETLVLGTDYEITYPEDCTSVGRKEVTITLIDEDETYVFSGETRIDTFYYYICDKLIQLWEYGISDGMSVELLGGTAAPFANLGQDYAEYISITDGTASSVGEYTTIIKNINNKYVIIEYKDQYNSSYYRELKTSDNQLEIYWHAKRAIFTENDERVEVTGLENMGYTIGSNFTLSWDGNVNFGDTLTRGTDYDVYFYIPQLFEADEDVTTLFASDADGTVYDVVLRIVFDGNYGGYVDKTIKLCPSIEGATVEALDGATMISDSIQFQYGLKTPPFNLKMTIKGEEKTLVYGTDFDVHSSYLFGSVNSASPLTLEAEGIGDYAGICNISYSLTAKSLNDESMTYNADSNAHYIGEDTQLNIQIYDTNYSDIYTIDSINYDVSYEFDTDNNIGIATITGRNNYKDSFDVEFHLANRAWGDSELTWDLKWDIEYNDYDALFYSATPKYPDLVIRYDGELLTEGTDYDLSVSNWNLNELLNLNITFKGNYYGVAAFPFFIVPVIIEGIEPYVVKNGAEATLDLTIKNKNNEVLTLNDDYEITYVNNTEFGIATFTIALDSENIIAGESVSGNIVGTFNVAGTVLTEDDFKIEGLDNGDYSITRGQTYVPNPTITYNGAELTKDTDYKIVTVVKDSAGNIHTNGSESGISNSDADGSVYYATTTIEFIDQYYGTFTYNTLIVPRIDSATIVPKDDARTEISYLYYTYTGSNIVPDFELELEIKGVLTTLTLGTDFEISDLPDEMKNVGGDYYFYINGINNFGGSIPVMVEIEALDSSFVDFECDGYALYTGEAVTPTVVLTDKYNNTLIENKDYQITYLDNVDLGEATYEVSFMGNYGGDPKNGSFRIVSTVITNADLENNKLVIDGLHLDRNNDYTIGVGRPVNMTSTLNDATVKYNDVELTSENYSSEYTLLDAEGNECRYNSDTIGLTSDMANGDVYRIVYTFTFTSEYFGKVVLEQKLCPSLQDHIEVEFKNNISTSGDTPVYAFTGEQVLPEFDKVTFVNGDSRKELVLNQDYIIDLDSGRSYIGPSDYVFQIYVKGMGDYAGSAYVSYYIFAEIKDSDLGDKLVIEGLPTEDLAYVLNEGREIIYDFSGKVSYNNLTLEADVNYSLEVKVLDSDNQEHYYDASNTPGIIGDDCNFDVYRVQFIFTFSGGYTGTVTHEINLCPSIETANFTFSGNHSSYDDAPTYIYTKEKIIPTFDTFTLSHNGVTKTLVKDTDYEIIEDSDTDYVNFDPYKKYVIVKGIGNYAGSKEIGFYISKYKIEDLTILHNDKYPFDQHPSSNDVKIIADGFELLNPADGQYYEIYVIPNADQIKLQIQGFGFVSGVKEFDITLAEENEDLVTLTSNDISLEDDPLVAEYNSDLSVIKYNFTGEEITPTLTIRHEGATLVEGTDYEVVAFNNVNPGTYNGHSVEARPMNIFITGKGNYHGIVNLNAHINMDEIDLSDVSFDYNGKNIDVTTYTSSSIKSISCDEDVLNAGTYDMLITANPGYGFKVDNEYVTSATKEITVNAFIYPNPELEIEVTPTYDKASYGLKSDGSAVEPLISQINFKGEGVDITLTEGTDFKIASYEDNTEAGTGKIHVNILTSNISLAEIETLDLEFEIKGKDISDYISANNIDFDYQDDDNCYFLYTGSSIQPIVTVDGLTLDTDYEVDYDDNLEELGTIYIRGLGEYGGELEISFIIRENILLSGNTTIVFVDKLEGYDNPTYISTGEQLKPTIKVLYNEEKIDSSNYNIIYGDNVLSSGVIGIEGKNDFIGSIETEFTILNYDINDAEFELEGFDSFEDGVYIYQFNGENPNLSIETITYNGLTFEEGIEIVEFDISDPGTYTLRLYGVGEFYGEKTISCKTEAKLVKDLKIEYTNSIITSEELLAANSLASCGTVTSIDEAKNVGTYNITFELNKGYAIFDEDEEAYLTEATISFEVIAKVLTQDDLSIELDDYYLATGEEITPSFVLKYDDTQLVLDTDYEAGYSNNITAGKGLISITLKNNYSNDEDIEFEFNIYYDFEEAEVTLEGFDDYTENTYVYEFDGTNPTITAKVTYKDVEYENSCSILSYDISKPGSHTLTLQGINDFYGEQEINCETIYLQIKNLKIEYTNSNITFDELLEANYLEDAATLISIDEAKNVGTYNVSMKLNKGYALIDDDGNYLTEGTTTFEIYAKKLTKDDLTIELEDHYIATGEELEPEFTLKYGSVELVLDTDYEVNYSENIDSGKGQIKITLLNNYSNTEDIIFEFNIYYDFKDAVLDINGFDDIVDGTYIYEFDGRNPEITVSTITFNEIGYEAMCEIEEYDISIPGEHVITINGNGEFYGSQTINVRTKVILLDDLEIEFNNNSISFNDVMEANDIVDFGQGSVIDDEAKNVGTYHAAVYLNKGYAIYQDSKYLTEGTTTFRIIPKTLTKEDLDINFNMADAQIPTYYATGNEIKPEFELYYGNNVLTSDDFEASYSNNVLPGTATITINLINNYKNEEEISYEFMILAKTMYNTSTSYTGKVIYMMDILKEKGLDQAIEKIKNGDYSARYAGTYTCYIVLKDGFSFDDEGLITEGEYSWTILPFEVNLEDVVVEIAKQAYTGKPITPAISISLNGREIRVEDYDLALENNTEIGIATATIKLKNNFISEGEIVKEFEIFDPDAPFKAYRTRVVKSLDSYLSDNVAANLANNISKLATADDIKSLYLATMPTILANKLLSIGGYITSIKDITESDEEGLNKILGYYNELEEYVLDNKYISAINTALEDDLLTTEVLTNDIKAVLDLLVSDLGYSKFASFIEDLINASKIEQEKANVIETIEKQIRTCYKVTVLTVLEHQKEELKAQEYIVQTDDNARENYLENFKEEVYRQRILYQIQLQHQMAQSRSINSVTDVYNNLLKTHDYNEFELLKLKDILDEYVLSINELEACQTEDEEVELIYQMASMAEDAIYDLYDVGVANIVSDEVIISSSTGINKDAIVKVELNSNISSEDIINAKNNGIISDINKTDEELEELVSNKQVLRVMDISIVAKDEVVNEFDGIYTVKIPLANDLKNVNDPVVVFINADGTLEVLETYVEGEFLVFKTTHFSNYAVIGNKVVDLGWLLILLLVTFVVEVFIVVYLIKLTKPFKTKKALGLLTILPTGFVGYLVTLIVLNIIGIAAIVYLIVRFNKSCDKEVDKNE